MKKIRLFEKGIYNLLKLFLSIKFTFRSKEKILPFGWQQLSLGRDCNNVVITSSEANALAINQATGIMALALKNLSQLPQEVCRQLNCEHMIILGTVKSSRSDILKVSLSYK